MKKKASYIQRIGLYITCKSEKGAKIRNRYNQASHYDPGYYCEVTTSQLDITIESQEVSPFQAGDLKALTNRQSLVYFWSGADNTV